MSKKTSLKNFRKITQSAAPVGRTVKWNVLATEENLEELKVLSEKPDIQVGDDVELEGEVFIKRLTFAAQQEAAKAFEWDVQTDSDSPVLKEINHTQLVASRLLGTICEDAKGALFFHSIEDIYTSDPAFINAIYGEADNVNNFMGKLKKKSLTETNSGVNSSSTELVEEPSSKRKKK